MKLVKADISGFRSIVDRTVVEFSDGINTITGRNNCGKSNILAAITLAMDGDWDFIRERDTSEQKASSLVRVVLEFQLHPNTSPEKTLLRYAQAYEEALKVRPLSTLASNGVVRFVVEYKNGIRSEYFQGYRSGALRLASDNDTHRKMLNQFRSTVRFVYIKSGENVQSLLSGRFRDILNLVLRDHLHAQYKSAEAMRDSYRTGLASDLLNPLQEKALKVVSKIFPDIEQADLIPMIPTLDSTLADMQIRLRDKADTGLDSKGTGIRGGVLLALLQYLVEQSKRSLVLAVEEPESFLHPGAQEDLRDGLEDLVERREVTLLVTTHSSFIVSRREGSKVIVLAKDDEGQTFIRGSSEGDDPNVSLSSELFRDQSVGDMLERVATAGIGDAEGFLIVEGETDQRYLEIAADRLNRTADLRRLKVVPAGGAKQAALLGILYRDRYSQPTLVLLDSDGIGRESAKRLEAFGFDKKSSLVSLHDRGFLGGEVEGEGLWPEALHERFVSKYGDKVLAGRTRAGKGGFNYDYTKIGKELIPAWLDANAQVAHCEKWDALLTELIRRLDLLLKP